LTSLRITEDSQLRIWQIGRIKEALAGTDTELKLGILQELSEHCPGWNTSVTDIFLSGLQDQQATVRIATVELLRLYPDRLSQQQLLQVLQLITDSDRQVREIVIDEIRGFGRYVEDVTLREITPLLGHSNEDVRESVVLVLDKLSHLFTAAMFLDLVDEYRQGTDGVRDSIADFLQRNGQESLIDNLEEEL